MKCTICSVKAHLKCARCGKLYCTKICQKVDHTLQKCGDQLFPHEERQVLKKDRVYYYPARGLVVKYFAREKDYDAQLDFLGRNKDTGLVPEVVYGIVENPVGERKEYILVTRYKAGYTNLYEFLERGTPIPDKKVLLNALVRALCRFYSVGDNSKLTTMRRREIKVYLDYVDLHANANNIGFDGENIVFYEGGVLVEEYPDLFYVIYKFMEDLNNKGTSIYPKTKKGRKELSDLINECLPEK